MTSLVAVAEQGQQSRDGHQGIGQRHAGVDMPEAAARSAAQHGMMCLHGCGHVGTPGTARGHGATEFLDPAANAQGRELRARVATPAIAYFRKNLCQALPSGTPEHVVEERLHQLLACQHGMSVLLITYPHVYRITKEAALRELECLLDLLLETR